MNIFALDETSTWAVSDDASGSFHVIVHVDPSPPDPGTTLGDFCPWAEGLTTVAAATRRPHAAAGSGNLARSLETGGVVAGTNAVVAVLATLVASRVIAAELGSDVADGCAMVTPVGSVVSGDDEPQRLPTGEFNSRSPQECRQWNGGDEKSLQSMGEEPPDGEEIE